MGFIVEKGGRKGGGKEDRIASLPHLCRVMTGQKAKEVRRTYTEVTHALKPLFSSNEQKKFPFSRFAGHSREPCPYVVPRPHGWTDR